MNKGMDGRPTQGMSGVAVVWIHRKVAGAFVGYKPISSRDIVVRLNVKHYPDSIVRINDSSHRRRNGEVLPRLAPNS